MNAYTFSCQKMKMKYCANFYSCIRKQNKVLARPSVPESYQLVSAALQVSATSPFCVNC